MIAASLFWCIASGSPRFVAEGALPELALVALQLLGELGLGCQEDQGVCGVVEQVVPQLQFGPPQPESRVDQKDLVMIIEVGEQVGQELPQGHILAGPQHEHLDISVGNSEEVVPQIFLIPFIRASWS